MMSASRTILVNFPEAETSRILVSYLTEEVDMDKRAKEVRTLEEEKELHKRKENEPTRKEEKIESSLVTDESYVSRSEATELTKQFFRNNLEDSDCRTFITTRGEVIISNSNIYIGVLI